MTDVPLFVVVGNVNQGKSSIVAALTENEEVPIDSYPGTTKETAQYEYKFDDDSDDGIVVFRMIDTPGFQRARKTLEWLQRQNVKISERPQAVRKFVEVHATDEEFINEVELLRPILDGAGILYVVDASSHLEPSNEAEMEILKWTGQPVMALINRVRQRDYSDEWRPTLRQFFPTIREFNAQNVHFADRCDLLRSFAEIRPEWNDLINDAIEMMEQEWEHRKQDAARVIEQLMCDAISHVEKSILSDINDEETARYNLDQVYKAAQRRFEAHARKDMESLYKYEELEREDQESDLLRRALQKNLFAEKTWKLFGLSRLQLAAYGAAWGAAAGSYFEYLTTGALMGIPTVIVAVFGAATSLLAGNKLASIKALSRLDDNTGRILAIGPVSNPNFAWVLLNRALVHYRIIRDRSHAQRGVLKVPDTETGVVHGLWKEQMSKEQIKESVRKMLSLPDELYNEAIRELSKLSEGMSDRIDKAIGELSLPEDTINRYNATRDYYNVKTSDAITETKEEFRKISILPEDRLGSFGFDGAVRGILAPPVPLEDMSEERLELIDKAWYEEVRREILDLPEAHRDRFIEAFNKLKLSEEPEDKELVDSIQRAAGEELDMLEKQLDDFHEETQRLLNLPKAQRDVVNEAMQGILSDAKEGGVSSDARDKLIETILPLLDD